MAPDRNGAGMLALVLLTAALTVQVAGFFAGTDYSPWGLATITLLYGSVVFLAIAGDRRAA